MHKSNASPQFFKKAISIFFYGQRRELFCFIKTAKVNSPVNGWEENPCVQIISKALTLRLCTNGEPGSAPGLVLLGKRPQDR